MCAWYSADMADLVEVLSTPSPIEARLTASALESLGLHPTLRDENLARTLGAGRLEFPIRILVPLAEKESAQHVIAAIQSDAERQDPEICPDCGAPWEAGFDVCWKCGPGAEPEPDRAPVHGHLQVRVDGLTAFFQRVPEDVDIAMLAAAPALVVLSVMVGSSALVFWSLPVAAVMVWAAHRRFVRTRRIEITVHALQVGDERWLWEDIILVRLGRYRIRWQLVDGTMEEVRVITTAADRQALREAIRVQRDRQRAPRDSVAQREVQRLTERGIR